MVIGNQDKYQSAQDINTNPENLKVLIICDSQSYWPVIKTITVY